MKGISGKKRNEKLTEVCWWVVNIVGRKDPKRVVSDLWKERTMQKIQEWYSHRGERSSHGGSRSSRRWGRRSQSSRRTCILYTGASFLAQQQRRQRERPCHDLVFYTSYPWKRPDVRNSSKHALVYAEQQIRNPCAANRGVAQHVPEADVLEVSNELACIVGESE
jgi:hypothetical protein